MMDLLLHQLVIFHNFYMKKKVKKNVSQEILILSLLTFIVVNNC